MRPTYVFRCTGCRREVESSKRDLDRWADCVVCWSANRQSSWRRVWTAPNLSAAARGRELPIHHGRDE